MFFFGEIFFFWMVSSCDLVSFPSKCFFLERFFSFGWCQAVTYLVSFPSKWIFFWRDVFLLDGVKL